jgi:hypothetical protein
MNVGCIVRLKPEHYLNQFIKGDCSITQVVKYSNKHRKTRYHIKNSEDCMTWVYLEEIDLISDLRDQRLSMIGIN